MCQIIKQHKTVRGNLACTMPPKTNVLLPIPDDRALRLSALPACIEKWIYKLEGGSETMADGNKNVNGGVFVSLCNDDRYFL